EQKGAPPGRELVGPRFDDIDVETRPRRRERCRPAVVPVQPHGNPVPGAGALGTPAHRSGDHLMAIAEHVGPDVDRLARNSLGWESPTIDGWVDFLDDEPFGGEPAD